MIKHTQGPWELDAHGDIVGNGETLFYPVNATKEDIDLVNAAPELLEALGLALSAIEQTTSEMTVGDRFTNAGQSLIDALMPCREAIAKAAGEQ